MPYAEQAKRRKYARDWRRKRRMAFFADKTCYYCGSAGDLSLHHLDPLTKTDHNIWSWSRKRREAEIAKCKVLCRLCHELAEWRVQWPWAPKWSGPGVTYNPHRKNPWRARIQYRKEIHELGYWPQERLAHEAVTRKRLDLCRQNGAVI